jgi:hypothetical protein
MQLPSSGGRTRTIQQKNMSTGRLAPAERQGAPTWCHGFCTSRRFREPESIPPSSTMAKTHATPKLRQHAHTAERYRQFEVTGR